MRQPPSCGPGSPRTTRARTRSGSASTSAAAAGRADLGGGRRRGALRRMDRRPPKRVDEASYKNRFTPRKARSKWSIKNVERVAELTDQGRMLPAGIEAFERGTADNTGIYSFEQETVELAPAYERELKANAKAWEFFSSKPPSYRRPAINWVMSAKREETRLRRLATLIEDSAEGRTIKPLTRPGA